MKSQKEGGGAGAEAKETPTLILLHGTGGNEEDLIPIARLLSSEFSILSPRGKVLENGIYPRFFRRLAEGIFDIEDLKFRTRELVEFIIKASKIYGFDLQNIIALGYSNGANIAASIILLYPEIFNRAILFRPMVPIIPDKLPELYNKKIFISAGTRDPIVSGKQTKELVNLLRNSESQVDIHWQDGAGHELTSNEIHLAKNWL
ncbi:MAG: alpha/beta hydrolase [Candidatus Nitrosocosmicus sp.]